MHALSTGKMLHIYDCRIYYYKLFYDLWNILCEPPIIVVDEMLYLIQ